jgi:hypothetical protein
MRVLAPRVRGERKSERAGEEEERRTTGMTAAERLAASRRRPGRRRDWQHQGIVRRAGEVEIAAMVTPRRGDRVRFSVGRCGEVGVIDGVEVFLANY